MLYQYLLAKENVLGSPRSKWVNFVMPIFYSRSYQILMCLMPLKSTGQLADFQFCDQTEGYTVETDVSPF